MSAPRARQRRPRASAIALVAIAALAALELGGGIVAHSLALMADAAHVAMDVVALGDRARGEHPGDASGQRAADVRLRAHGDSGRARQRRAAGRGSRCSSSSRRSNALAIPELPHGRLMVAIALVGLVVNVGIGVMLLRADAQDRSTCARRCCTSAATRWARSRWSIGGAVDLR